MMEENVAFKIEEETIASGNVEVLPLEEPNAPKEEKTAIKMSTRAESLLLFNEEGIPCGHIENANSFLLISKEESENNEICDDPVWTLMSELQLSEPKTTASINVHKEPKCSDKANSYIKANLEDIRSVMFWKAVIAEFLGTFIFVLTSAGSTVHCWNPDNFVVVQISFCFGFCVSTSIWFVEHISGGHINPAVTMSVLCIGKIGLLKAIMFITSQCFGAIAGASLVKSLTPASATVRLGTTTLSAGMSPLYGLLIECILTMILVLTVFASRESKRTDIESSFPLAIGLYVTLGHLLMVKYCGSSMNPARSLGPAVVMNIWKDHWVYWIGPILGGTVRGLFHNTVIASNSTFRKAFRSLMAPQIDYGYVDYCSNDNNMNNY